MTRARDTANLIGSGNFSSTTFTATAGQTAFTISHTQGFVQVFMNGLLLDETADYTSNGTAITLTSGAAAGDEIEVVSYDTFSVGDAIPTSGGTFTGAVTASNGLTVDDDGATPLTVDRATSNGTIIDVQKDGTSVGSIGTYSGDMTVGTGDTRVRFIDSLDCVVPVSDAIGTSRDAAVDLGYSSIRYKDLYLSGGAYIGGTGASNKLEDYEEGTWTPVLGGSTSTSGQSYSAQAGTYTKIGNTVNAHAYISLSNAGTVSGTYAYIMGFPFNVTNNSGSYPAFSIGYFAGLGQNVSSLGGYLNKNTPTAYVTFRQGAGVDIQYLSAGGIGTASMIFSITYNTAA